MMFRDKNLTKKWIAVLLASVTLCNPACAAFAATADRIDGLPKAGDLVCGFRVESVEAVPAIGAQAVRFTHEKSGAILVYFANGDKNRVFDITFRTPALDDKGKPHVFEHITISGSQKYPDPNLFFPFYNRTYNTFVNALTYPVMTTFPVSSLSEDQLMTMMDFYLAGVFQPLLLTEPRLAKREAWRYELDGADSPLMITGTVYSEMKGALTIERAASDNLYRTLYPGSATAYESGGIPEHIKELTYEELVAFHEAYYQPSNALICLYGDLDYERFLRFIDENYLSAYDKTDVYVERGFIDPIDETMTATLDYPASADTVTEHAAYADYAFSASGVSARDSLGLSLLATMLLQDSSTFKQLARERLPGVNVTCSVDTSRSMPLVDFRASGCNPEDQETFNGIVEETLASLAADGIPQDVFESVTAMNKLSLLLIPESGVSGLSAILSNALEWASFGTTDYLNTYQNLLETADLAYFNGLADQYLISNKHRAVTLTKPAPGLAEANNAALEQELAARKAGMSGDEIDALVAETAAFAEFSAAPADAAVLAPLLNVTVDTLPEELEHYEVTDRVADGVRLVSAPADVGGVCMAGFMLDVAGIPLEDLQDAAFYLSLLGNVDTASHTKEELSAQLTRYALGFGPSLSAETARAGDARYLGNISWICMSEDMDTAADLIAEILYTSDFSDTETIKGIVTRARTSFKTTFESTPNALMKNRLAAAFSDTDAFNELLSGLANYTYLGEIETELTNDPAATLARLERARTLLYNKAGAVAVCGGDEAGIAKFESLVGTLLAGMTDAPRNPVDHAALRLEPTREALVSNTEVQYNYVYMRLSEQDPKLLVAANLLSDLYMLPQLRNALGAYGANAVFSGFDAVLSTYRDPNLAKTYALYEALPDFIDGLDIAQADIDPYIISTYATFTKPAGQLTGALRAIDNAIAGVPESQKLDDMRAIKAFTADDLHAVSALVREMLETGARATAGKREAIDANAGLFDHVTSLND